jgi:hypothetical protein
MVECHVEENLTCTFGYVYIEQGVNNVSPQVAYHGFKINFSLIVKSTLNMQGQFRVCMCGFGLFNVILLRVKICDPSAIVDAIVDTTVQDQAYREATTRAQDAVQDTPLLNQVNHVGSTASLANIHCRAETNMASGDLTAASYVTKERRAEANNTRKGNITPFNHARS